MIVERRNDEDIDQFPVGMRVLAVDDDPICLRLLETLLRKCQYNVTTRDRAIDALELLRENRDKFDLVISDVHMPDMDGFKLLELVGLEMDLPVIMLSANGDTKLVMKGITHGACDYLVKPIRLEELKNIWQHVIRRKKSDRRDQNNSDNREKRSCPVDEEQKGSRTGESDQGGRVPKRRKDQDEDDDEDSDENEDHDPSSQKKARVVWSVELHRKFVAAVNQLGFDRAVPKKILELMNVEKLTRENVASHLQKYRLYLKRLSSVANQQANMVAALGGTESAYLRMNSMNFHNFNASAQYQNNALRSLPPSGMLGRLNSPAGLGIHALSPSGMTPLGHTQMTRNHMPDSTKFQLPRDQTGNILQGMPTSLEFDQLHIPPNAANGPGNNPLSTLPNSSLLLPGHSMATVPFRPDSAFGLTDPNRSDRSWPNGPSTSYPPQEGYRTPHMLHAFNSSSNAFPTALNGVGELQISSGLSGFDAGCQNAALGNRNNQNMGYAAKPLWGDHKLGNAHHSDLTNSSLNPSMAAPVGDPTGVLYGGNNDFGLSMNSSSTHLTTTGVSGMNSTANLGGFAANGAGSLEDVVTSVIKWEQDDSALLAGSDLGGDTCPLRTCI